MDMVARLLFHLLKQLTKSSSDNQEITHIILIKQDECNKISLFIVTLNTLNPQTDIPGLVSRELATNRIGIAGDVLQQ